MPAGRSIGAAIVRQGGLFFPGGHKRSFARIKADKKYFVVAARIEGEHLERATDTLLNLIAEHGTAVIDKCEQHRLAAEIFAQLHIAARLVAEIQVQGQLRVEL